MITEMLSIGDRAEVTLKRDNRKIKKFFATQIVDFADDNTNRFFISCPISLGKLVLLPQNEIYSLMFYTKSSIISCDCKVVGHFKNGELHNTLMEATSDFERTQRRQFFRYACLIPFKYAKIDVNSEEHEPEQHVTMVDGIIKDLSGGGVRFVSKEGLEIGDYIQLVLPINKDTVITIGNVIYKAASSSSSALYKFEYRLKFSTIEKIDQDRIVRFVLEEQRRLLQKTGTIRR